jgi:hypothetical protein
MRGYKEGFLGIFLIVLFSVLPAAVSGGQTADQGTPYFTNKDIEKYARPSDGQQPAAASEKPRKPDVHTRATSEGKEKEYWCKKASSAKKTLEKKKDRIAEIEREIAEREARGFSGGKAGKSLQKRLARAKRDHRYAEEGFREIAEEAHRKGVPAGWLRCQFE